MKAFTEDPLGFGRYAPLFEAGGREHVIERLRPAKDVVIAKFRGVDDRTAAEALNGIELYIRRDSLPTPEEDEFYHADLIGLAAFSATGDQLGTIAALHNFGSGDILEVVPPRGTPLLVPFTRAAVPAIDVAGGRLTVVPPAEADADPEAEAGEHE